MSGLLTKVKASAKSNYDVVLSAFKLLDSENSGFVTKGEFRRVIEINCFKINTKEFNELLEDVEINKNSTINYILFLQECCTNDANEKIECDSTCKQKQQTLTKPLNTSNKIILEKSVTIDEIEQRLKKAIQQNYKSIYNGFRLFDYNKDGKIQRHELRKILESHCFLMNDMQFEKLWNRFDYSRIGIINYHDFLLKLGAKANDQIVEYKQNPLSVIMARNLDQLEVDFRRNMKIKMPLLLKTFLILDPMKSGLVKISAFKKILSDCVVDMSDKEFVSLMKKLEFKANHEVQWLLFLQKFQDPQNLSNGMTIPIRSSHKANATKGENITSDTNNLIALLCDHIVYSYNSVREAFLHLDKNKKGKIACKYLKNIFDGFKYKVYDFQIKEIMQILDPQQTGYITYSQFLELFEEKESADGHKWLVSTHKYNSNTKPAILAWKTVEDLLKQKICFYWKDVVAALKFYDPLGTGLINSNDMKEILKQIAMPVSDEHFQYLISHLTKMENSDKLNYLEFLSLLDIDVHPGDNEGVSTKLTKGNEAAILKRQLDHEKIMETIDLNAAQRVSIMSLDEIITRLQDKNTQSTCQIRQAFLQMQKNRHGFISKKKFREFLQIHGIILSDANFEQLTKELEFTPKGLDYTNFVKHLELKETSLHSYLPKQNHKWNNIRGDEFGMNVDTVEKKLRTKLRENFSNLRQAFHKIDNQATGCITKKNFRQLLDQFMCFVNDEEFEKLCQMLNIDENSQITYKDFLKLFQETDDIDIGHKWLVSNHKYNENIKTYNKTAEEVRILLADKLHENFKDIAKTFCQIDYLGRGYITRKEFRDMLHKMNMTMTDDEFKLLWNTYDKEKKNLITYDAFIHQIGVGDAFTSGDDYGTSAKIVQNSAETISNHLESQENRHDNITFNQAVLSVSLDINTAYLMLQKRFRDVEKTPYIAFKNLDKTNKGFLTYEDFAIALQEMHVYLTNENLILLFKKIGLLDENDKMTYKQFCYAFEEKYSGPTSSNTSANKNTKNALSSSLKRYKQEIEKHCGILQVVLQTLDEENKNKINVVELRRVLDEFCFPVKDVVFKELISESMVTETEVDYNNLLGIRKVTTDENWENIHEDQTSIVSEPPTIDDLEERLRDVIFVRPSLLQRAFNEVDVKRVGVCSRTEFKNIYNKFVFRITDEQFHQLLYRLPQNEYGNIEYHKLLSSQSTQTTDITGGTLSKPQTSRPQTAPAKNYVQYADKAEQKLKKIVSSHWRQIFAQCKLLTQKNVNSNNQVSIYEFCQIIEQLSGVKFTTTEIAPCLSRFGLRANAMFRYQDFLKSFMFDRQEREETARVQEKLNRARISIAIDATSQPEEKWKEDSMLGLAMRLRRRVLEDWKEMRKNFKKEDTLNSGMVSAPVFKKVLRHSGIHLTDEEFQRLIFGIDDSSPHTAKFVNYAQFIRSFLRSA